ncbi:DEAD/DEAH box helicase [Dechloromonas sp. HYN0024]|uniref:DEAD/DEAH box helicase n=1 Tax=Dechloromonas sp. HYN0024 TaxID=2231055 RepID=UPI000E44BBFC|nr:DEAD/DEAH box helicase [Dechloromonas sp. HYN0024]AXS81522.1 RNA helicase [Dechloromonas sp. HYN0024]
MQFTDLGLKAELLRAVSEQGYDTPTPIQAQAIPAVMTGRDLMATAQTGTGKTAGFTLPILHRLCSGPNDRLTRITKAPRVLVLTPTRELAIQVEESVRTYGKYLPVNSLAVFGGVGINPQIANLRRGVDVLVATPGRLLDHVQQRTVDLSKVEIFVLDEADRMLDMGFIRDIRKIIALLPKQRQNLMFSATFSPDIRELAAGLLHNPASVDVAARNTAAETVTQRVIETNRDQKKELLCHLFETRGWHQVLVFARTKHGADALSRTLEKAGIKSAAIHGDKSQGARTRALTDFKEGKLVALVATDIAARGIDIDALPYVINYELPNVAEDYVHRIGRTGRAGMEGEAISLVSHDERGSLRDIERLIKRDLEREVIPGFEPSAIAPPKPVQPPRGARKPQPGRPQAQKSGQKPGGPQQHRSGSRHR